MFRDEADRRGLRLEIDVEEDLPPVDSGADLLEQVMENLVSNAIKYTPEGGTIQVAFKSSGPGSVQLIVTDTGIGIPTQEQEKLFHEFFRASNAKKITSEGTGLGLVLVKQTVERHGGSLDLLSEEGRGTTVTIELPIHREPSDS
jgi:signal transduction histidine kinase